MAIKTLAASGVLYTDRRNFYIDPSYYAKLYPMVAPFATIMWAKGVQTTPDADFKCFEHRASWRYQYFLVNAGSPSAWSASGVPGATVAVAMDGAVGVSIDSSLLQAEVEIWDSTETTLKGYAFVSAVSGSTVTLKALGHPEVSNQAMTALADNDKIFVIGTAFGEGTEAPDATSDELEVVWNSTQEQKTSVEITKALQNAVLRGRSDELSRLREDRGNEHKIKKARTYYWGMRTGGIGGTAHGAGGGADSTFIGHTTDAAGNTVRTTMGIITALRRYGRRSGAQQNWFDRNFADYTYDKFVDDTEKLAQYLPMSGELTAFVGPTNMSFWSKIGAEGLLTAAGTRMNVKLTDEADSPLGLRFRRLVTPHVTIKLVTEQLFRGTPYSKDMLIVNEDNVGVVKYENDEYNTNIKTDNDPRSIKDEYFSNDGLKIDLMEGHSYFRFS